MAKERTVRVPEEQLIPVEELAVRLGVRDWKLAGIMRNQKWAPGKSVTEKDFLRAAVEFNDRPMGK